MTSAFSSPEPGPLAEEVARLLSAAGDFFHRTVGDPATSRIATESSECSWCPVCQLIRSLRGSHLGGSEQLLGSLVEVQTALAGLIRSLSEAAGRASTAPADGPTDRPSGRVQPIDLEDGD